MTVLLDQTFCVEPHLVGQPELVAQDSIVSLFLIQVSQRKQCGKGCNVFIPACVKLIQFYSFHRGYMIALLESSALPSHSGANLTFGSQNEEGLPHHLGIQHWY